MNGPTDFKFGEWLFGNILLAGVVSSFLIGPLAVRLGVRLTNRLLGLRDPRDSSAPAPSALFDCDDDPESVPRPLSYIPRPHWSLAAFATGAPMIIAWTLYWIIQNLSIAFGRNFEFRPFHPVAVGAAIVASIVGTTACYTRFFPTCVDRAAMVALFVYGFQVLFWGLVGGLIYSFS